MEKTITQIAASLFIFSAALWAQATGQPVNQVTGAPPTNVVQQLYYSGSNVTAICNAAAATYPTLFTIGGTPALTSIAVSSNVGTVTLGSTAYFWPGQVAVVSGSTTPALNGSYRVNSVSGSTFTITTSGVTNGTYNNSTLTLTTSQPLLNAPLWSIEIFTYSGSNVSGIYWAGTPTGSTVPQNLACSNEANY